jgi:hypothetical protein
MMNYKDKYIKYKNKYIDMLNQKGGTKIFNLENEYDCFVSDDLQNNLAELEKKFSNSFHIKNADIDLIFELEKINHKPYNNIEFYRLIHKVEKRTTSREPLVIDFIDPITLELNNNCCLTSIQRTANYSGKQLVNLCIEICKKLKVNKIITGDEATINCDGVKIDLSLIKLIENKRTYYMGMGFDVEKSNSNFFLLNIKDKNTILTLISEYVDRIRLIKTKKIIKETYETICLLKKAQETNYSNNLEIMIDFPKIYHQEPSYVDNPISIIPKILENLNKVNAILQTHKEYEFIFLLLVDLSKTNCKEYSVLIEYLMNPYIITYDSKTIKRNYIDDFVMLKGIKSNCLYSYLID